MSRRRSDRTNHPPRHEIQHPYITRSRVMRQAATRARLQQTPVVNVNEIQSSFDLAEILSRNLMRQDNASTNVVVEPTAAEVLNNARNANAYAGHTHIPSVTEPKSTPEPKPVPETKPESVPASKPAPELETKSSPEPLPESKPALEPSPESVPAPAPRSNSATTIEASISDVDSNSSGDRQGTQGSSPYALPGQYLLIVDSTHSNDSNLEFNHFRLIGDTDIRITIEGIAGIHRTAYLNHPAMAAGDGTINDTLRPIYLTIDVDESELSDEDARSESSTDAPPQNEAERGPSRDAGEG